MKTVKELKKQVSKKNKMNLLLFSLICVITLTFTMGYSLLNQKLNISGEAVYRKQAIMRITDLSEPTIVNGGDITYNGTYSVNSVSLHVELPNKDSKVSYEVEMTNIGNINQWIKSINATSNNDNIVYKIDGLTPQEDIIYSPDVSDNNVKTFTITFLYKDSIKNGTDDSFSKIEKRTLSTIINFEYEILETYLITYDLDGGTVTSNPVNYTKADIITLNNPTKKGYEFLGWTGTDLNNTVKNLTIPKLSEGDRNYVANWEALPWAFTINPTPSNAIVTISDGTQTITGEGSTSLTSNAGNTITWSVSLDHYATQSGKQVILEDITKNISLTSTWSDWVTEKEATCTEKGIEYRICSICGTKETREIGLVDHVYNTTTVASTLTTRGHQSHTCLVCGHNYKDSYNTNLYIVKSSKLSYGSTWSGGVANRVNDTGGISVGTFDGKFTSTTPNLSVATGQQAVFYIGPINLSDVKNIYINSSLWSNGYYLGGLYKGTLEGTVGLATSDMIASNTNTDFVSGTSKSAKNSRTSSTNSATNLSKNIITSSLSGNYYIKIYLTHSMNISTSDYRGAIGFTEIRLDYNG